MLSLNSVSEVSLRHPLTILLAILCSATPISVSAQEKKPFRPKIHRSDPYKSSDILVSSGYHTVVPKHAVLAVPERLKDRVPSKPNGKFIIWPKFLQKNFGWIHKHPVTWDQASGKTPITQEKMDHLRSLGKVVVAVYKNNPVSVLPSKDTNSTKP